MAGIVGTVRDILTSRVFFTNAPSWAEFNDGYAPATSGGAMGIIQAVGIIPVAGGTAEVLGTTHKRYLVHAAHATISGYERLQQGPAQGEIFTDQCTAQTDASCDLEEWATTTNDLNGKSINAGQTMNFSISARRESGSSEDAHMELKFYHRTSGGAETLLDTVVFADLTTSYQDFTGTWSVSSDRAFGTDEKLVLKILNHNTGPPA